MTRLAIVVAAASGGTAGHVAALAAGCVRSGLGVSAFGPGSTRELFGPGITFTEMAISERPRPASDLASAARLRRGLREVKADVVHAHGVRAGAFAAMALLGRTGRPALVLTVHNAPPAGTLNSLIYQTLERVCVRRCDVVLCASSDLVARMRALGAAAAQQFDVPAAPAQPASAEAIAKVAADIGAAGRPVILAAGRLAPQKGFDMLVTAAARWRDRDPAPVTVIAGSGPLALQLAEQARRENADVLMLGERFDMSALLEVADVFVLPSRWEARALILQEAMRAGKPIVATRSGGTPDLTGDDSAVLVQPGDADAFCAAVLAVLDDATLAARLGLAARARAASFPTQEDALKRAVAIYDQLAADGRLC